MDTEAHLSSHGLPLSGHLRVGKQLLCTIGLLTSSILDLFATHSPSSPPFLFFLTPVQEKSEMFKHFYNSESPYLATRLDYRHICHINYRSLNWQLPEVRSGY